MTPEEIRQLYDRERAATDEEAAQTRADVERDPVLARAHIETLLALAAHDQHFALLVSGWLGEMMIRHIRERAAGDDAYALEAARALFAQMDKLGRRRSADAPTPRGKPGKARMA